MKVKLWPTPKPLPGTLAYRFVAWFCNTINWCEGYYYGTEMPKPDNKLYNVLYEYWLWPFVNEGCACCMTTRGVLYGAVLGFILGGLFW